MAALEIGISKKELLEDYYFDEIGIIFDRYNNMHTHIKDKEEKEEQECYWDDCF